MSEDQSGPIQEQIERKLKAEFSPGHLEVVNESSSHHVPPGSETHFRVVIVSDAFQGVSRVARQQMVYKILADELKGGVHALAQRTFTPEEWRALGEGNPFASPACRGGKASGS